MCAYLDGVGDGQAHGCGGHVAALAVAHGQQAGGHHHDGAEEVAPEGQPQVALLRVKQRQVVLVDAPDVLLHM